MTGRIDPDDTIRDYEFRHDLDKSKTIDSDDREFNQDSKKGFDLYVEKCRSQEFAGDFVSNIALPAHSSNGKQSCGQWKFIGCLEHDLHDSHCVYCRKVEQHCNSKGCKVCFESTIKREAKSITGRLMTFCNLKKNRKIYLKEQNRVRILSHVTISVPHDEYYLLLTKDGRKKLRQKQTKILKSLDVDGGVTINHPYRFTGGLDSAYVSPHFHNVITGWIDGNIVKQIYEQTGWIIKQISTMETPKDCYNLSKYLLSHAGVYEREVGKRSSEHSVSYFGECQNRKFKVDSVLKNSVTGYEELDKILYTRKEITRKGVDYPLQTVHYTRSIIIDSVKDSTNEYFRLDGSINDISKSLRQYITPQKDLPLDNPALSQSDPEPFEFLQMRLDYGNSQYSIVQSEYVNVILDPSLDELCPECSFKMRTLVPDDWSPQQADFFKNEIFPQFKDDVVRLDDSCGLQYLSKETYFELGMPYFKQDGQLDYETGIYSRPDCISKLNTQLYWSIIKNIDLQTFKYQFKLENGVSPTREEQAEHLTPTIIRTTSSHKLTEF